MWQTTCRQTNFLTDKRIVRDGCGDWLFMTPTLNDSMGTFLLSSIHQTLMISWKGRNANEGTGKWVRRTEKQKRERGRKETIIILMNEGCGRGPRVIAQSETGFCAPNFIIMTQSHQHCAPDKTRAETNSRKDHLKWPVLTGLSQSGLHSGIQPLSG